MDIFEERKIIRKKILALRALVSEDDRDLSSIRISERLLSEDLFSKADNVFLYASYGSELSTKHILYKSFELGKHVYYPRVIGDRMEFFEILSENMLQKGYKGIMEPVLDARQYIYSDSDYLPSVFIMPGTAFDNNRNRLGYGGGFYDRYLSDKEKLRESSIAIGYKCQLVESIPSFDWDIKPEKIILV